MIDTVHRLWRLLTPQAKLQLSVVFVLMLISSGLEVLGIYLVFPILKVVMEPDQAVTGMPWLAPIQDILGTIEPNQHMLIAGAGIVVVFLIKNAVSLIVTYFQYSLVWGQRARISCELLRKYLYADYAFHLQRSSANLLRNVTQSIADLFAGVVMPILLMATEALLSLGLLGLLLWMEPELTLIAAGSMTIAVLVFDLFVRRRLRLWGNEVQESTEERLRWPAQAFAGIKEIKALGREEYFLQSFARSTYRNSVLRRKFAVLNQFPRVYLEMLVIVLLIGSLFLIIERDAGIVDLVPTMGLFGLCLLRIMPSFNRMAGQFNALRFGTAALDNIFDDLISLEQDDAPVVETTVQPLRLRETLELRNVGFSYATTTATAAVLSDINLTIRLGESVAFVGVSGAGKTTLADLLLGIFTPTTGDILVDGVSIVGNRRAWQQSTAYIPQEVFMVEETLRGNITFGLPDSEIDEIQLAQAVEMSQLSEVVAMLPQGMDTQIGERGTRLSGGQRQRVAIARALFRDSDVLVLDEATSALDNQTEKDVSQAIEGLSGAKTVIVIAHRLSTVYKCDRIVFIKEGKIVDQGSFEEVTARNPAFRNLVELARLDSTKLIDTIQ